MLYDRFTEFSFFWAVCDLPIVAEGDLRFVLAPPWGRGGGPPAPSFGRRGSPGLAPAQGLPPEGSDAPGEASTTPLGGVRADCAISLHSLQPIFLFPSPSNR